MGDSVLILAGDVGGTKTRLAICSADAGPRSPLVEQVYPSGSFESLEAMVRIFLDETAMSVGGAVFGVAGPVVGGRAKITNLPWQLDEGAMAVALGVRSVRLLNDLEAVGHAVPFLEPGDLRTLSTGEPRAGGAIALIAPGTGLGEAFLTWDGGRYVPRPSEGGHAAFAPRTALETGLLAWLRERLGHVSYERVCSGIGLPNIYAYLKQSHHAQESPSLASRLAAADDPTPVIAGAAIEGGESNRLAVAALEIFVSALAGEAGNLALKVLATGGVYVGGGMPPKILPFLEDGRFLAAFREKGRMKDLLTAMPVHVIMNPKAALLGAAYHGLGY